MFITRPEYNVLNNNGANSLQFQEHLKQYNQTEVEGLIDEILKDVADAADQLQDNLDEHLFDKALQDADGVQYYTS